MQRLEKSFTICIIPNGPAILDMYGIHRTDRPRPRRHVVQICHNRLLMRNRHIESADPQGNRPGHCRGKQVRSDRKRHIDTVQVLLLESKGLHHG
jgi:hypothetical protein